MMKTNIGSIEMGMGRGREFLSGQVSGWHFYLDLKKE